MKIKVTQDVRLVHAGTVYGLGDRADIPDDVAAGWLRQGWASEVKTTPAKSSPRKGKSR